MLEESKEGSPIFFNSEGATGFSNKESLPSLPASGEVISRITGIRKMVTNYETYIAYQIQTVVSLYFLKLVNYLDLSDRIILG